MPLLYDEILVNSSGIVSVCDITLPANGRKVKFIMSNPYGYSDITSVDIYLKYEGKIVGPLESGDAVETSVIPIVGKLLSTPYDAKAIVVSTGYYSANSENSILLDYGIKSSMNMVTTAHIVMTYESSYHIKDSKEFVNEYMKGSFSPLATVTGFINSYLKDSGDFIIDSLNNIEEGILISNYLPKISKSLSRRCVDTFNTYFGWGEISILNINLTITNIDQILTELNRQAQIQIDRYEKLFDEELEARRKLLDANIEFKRELVRAIRDSFSQPTISEQLSPIIVAYLQSNPGVSYDEMVGVFTKLNMLAQRTSPHEILSAAKQLGMIEEKK